ncbi:MAG: terminase small subunit [Synergistaceae bacterium]|nr:terminase small subunit [Synergistaceae bacterium]
MTEKQERFALEYQKDCNATKAAIRAGYSEKTAYSIGQRLLKNVEVQKLVKIKSEERKSELVATSEQIKKFWTSIMNDETEDIKNRLRASELLAKAYGDFTVNIKTEEKDRRLFVSWLTPDNKEIEE